MSKYKSLFEKGYTRNWSTEIFRVSKILPTIPVTYLLTDLNDEPIRGCFYEEEIQKTNNNGVYLIEKTIRRKGNKLFVKWLGFDDSHSSWINAKDVV